MSISSYSAKLKAIWRELDLLWPTGDKNSLSYLREVKFRTLTFLMGLNPEYENLRSQLLHRERFPTLAEAISELQGAERRRKLTLKDEDSTTPTSVAHLAKRGEPRNNSSSWAPSPQIPKVTPKEGNPPEPLVCGYCRKEGHVKKDCRKLAWKEEQIRKGLWVPRDQKKAYVASEGGEPSTKKSNDGGEIQKLIQSEMSKILQKISSTSLARSGEHFAFTTYNNVSPISSSWILDSGATGHMSPQRSLFQSYDSVSSNHKVFTANDGILRVEGRGTVFIKGVILKDVLHVPELKANLLSLTQLVVDTGWRFTLDSDSCFLCIKDTGKKISSVRQEGGLLLLDDLEEDDNHRVVYNTKSAERFILLHRRLGHPSFSLLKHVYPNLFKGIIIDDLICESCQFAKHKRTVFPVSNHRSSAAFECVHSDVWGPCSTTGLFQHRWFILFVDDFTRHTWVYLLKSKSEVPSVVILFCEMIHTQFGRKVRQIRTDNAKEYFSGEVNTYLGDRGIAHQSSCVNTPQQNGLAERKIGHIMSAARALLFQGNCPKQYWSEAVATATHLINRTASRTLNFSAPIDLMSSEFPHLCLRTNLPAKIFGCIVYVHAHHAGKLDPRALKCLLLGYSSTQKGYRCYHPSSKRLYVTADASFDEARMFYDSESRLDSNLDPMVQELGDNGSQEISVPSNVSQQHMAEPFLTHTQGEEPLAVSESTPRIDEAVDEYIPGNHGWSIAISKGVRACTQTKRYPISNYVSYTQISPEYNKIIQALMTVSVPQSVKEAMSSNEWKNAMDEEMETLERNGTWVMGPLPAGKKLVGSRWVFTIKYHSDGSIARYKARLVARGYTQSYGIDYHETFAPVAKLNTIRVLIALAALFDWKLYQYDVKNAFLHGELEEEVYMSPPPGYSLGTNLGDVCHLKKSLYGLKQSPCAWFGKFSKTMLSAGFFQSEGDHTLFIKHSAQGKISILIVYVDDIIITGNDADEIQRLETYLTGSFDIKALGLLTYFLGIEVAYSKTGILLSQHKYILDLLWETGKLDCRPAATPVDINVKLKTEQHDKDAPVNKTSFQRLIGRLLYLNHTRPDIAFAVNSLSQFMSDPRESHQRAADRILAYLKGTIGQGLLFRRGGEPSVVLYTDSDYAGSFEDSRSTLGYCSFLGGNLATWRSQKQKEVSLSSAEAELRALKKGVCEGMWLKDILQDLHLFPGTGIHLYSDSKSAIAMAKNPVQHERTKHARVARHYIKKNIDDGFIVPHYIPTLEQVADVLTKGLPGPHFQALVSKLSMFNIYTQLEGGC
ncbi:DENN (AEX-3) domain-containing protein isoform X1 [Wolffia australiana]